MNKILESTKEDVYTNIQELQGISQEELLQIRQEVRGLTGLNLLTKKQLNKVLQLLRKIADNENDPEAWRAAALILETQYSKNWAKKKGDK
jgi:hypothetical protein